MDACSESTARGLRGPTDGESKPEVEQNAHTSAYVPIKDSTNRWPPEVATFPIIVLADGGMEVLVALVCGCTDVGLGCATAASSARNAIVLRHPVTRTNPSQIFGSRRSTSCSGMCCTLSPLTADGTRSFDDMLPVAASGPGGSVVLESSPKTSGVLGPCGPSARRREDCTYADIARKERVRTLHRHSSSACSRLDNARSHTRSGSDECRYESRSFRSVVW